MDGVATALGAGGDKGDGDVEGVLADDVHDSAEGLPIAGSGDVTGENHQVRGARAGFAIAHVVGDAGDVGGGAGFARGGGDNERDTVAREVPQARATSRRVGGYQGRLYMVPVLQVGLFIRRTKPTFKCFSRILGNGNACFQGS